MSPSRTAAEPAPRPGLRLEGPRGQACGSSFSGAPACSGAYLCSLGLPCTRWPPTSLDSRTVPQRAQFRPMWLQVYWPGGCQEETSPEGQPGGTLSAPRPVTTLPPG